jgi:hypothetical protein
MAQKIQLSLTTLIANSATIAAQSILNPGKDAIVSLDTGELETLSERSSYSGMTDRPPLPQTKKTTASLSSNYTLTLFLVFALTVISVLVEIALAALAKDPPTGFQQTLFGTADFVWKAGFGAIAGLIGSKQI